MPGYISQWWDSVTKKYKEVSKEDPFPVTMIGGGEGGAEEVVVTQPLPAGTNNIGHVTLDGQPISVHVESFENVAVVTSDETLNNQWNSLLGASRLYGWDGTNSRRLLCDTQGKLLVSDTVADGTALPNLARSANAESADLLNNNGKGATVIIDVTAHSGTASITVKIQGKDAASGKYYDILTSAAITGISTNVLKVHPGLTDAANSVANDILPHTWRVSVEHANADTIQYSVGYSIV